MRKETSKHEHTNPLTLDEDRILREISSKYNLPLRITKIICQHPFSFMRQMMRDPDLPSLNLKYYGKFRNKGNFRRTKVLRDPRFQKFIF